MAERTETTGVCLKFACPSSGCGRYLGEITVATVDPVATIRLYCQDCRAWRVLALGDGRPAIRRPAVDVLRLPRI